MAEAILANLIVGIVLLIMIVLAVVYIVKAKKRGAGCIGCPNASKCGGNCCCNKMPNR